MKFVRAAIWSLSIGVLSLLLAVSLVRAIGFALPVFLFSVFLTSALLTLLVEIEAWQGATGGAIAAILVVVTLRMTSFEEPPLWTLSAGATLLAAAAGWAGVFAVLKWRAHDRR